VSRRRTTFGKLQRDRDKQAKARAKVEKRQQKSDDPGDEALEVDDAPEVDQAKVLDQLARLHEAYDDGRIELDDFEEKRAELTSLLRVD
jgi:hypothetical protein